MKVYNCPVCGKASDFDGTTGELKCSNCGTTVNVEKGTLRNPTYNTGHEFKPHGYDRIILSPGDGEGKKAKSRTVSKSCQYCGTNTKPDGIAPLRISADSVRKIVKKWYGKQMFAPSFTSRSLEIKFSSPQFIPFWVFRAHIEGEYSGRCGKDITFVMPNSIHGIGFGGREGHLDKFGLLKTETITSWENIQGTESSDLENIGVPAQDRIDNEYSLFLFRSTPADAYTEWKPEYFAGTNSITPTVTAEYALEQAKSKMKHELEFCLDKKYDHMELNTFNVDYSNISWRLVQIPGYFFTCHSHGRIYVGAVNGVTGEISGTCPVSLIKLIIALLLATAVTIAGIVFLSTADGVNVCTVGNCRPSLKALSATIAIAVAIAAIMICADYIFNFGNNYQKDSTWLQNIMKKTNKDSQTSSQLQE